MRVRIIVLPPLPIFLSPSGPIVCVIDTGINLGHPDLIPNIHPTKGYNAITNVQGDAVNDDNSHGSHCAGISLFNQLLAALLLTFA